MADYIQIYTTTEKREEARDIARNVVEKRLAACAQVLGPIASTYWWKGIKTGSDHPKYPPIRGARDSGCPHRGREPGLFELVGQGTGLLIRLILRT